MGFLASAASSVAVPLATSADVTRGDRVARMAEQHGERQFPRAGLVHRLLENGTRFAAHERHQKMHGGLPRRDQLGGLYEARGHVAHFRLAAARHQRHDLPCRRQPQLFLCRGGFVLVGGGIRRGCPT